MLIQLMLVQASIIQVMLKLIVVLMEQSIQG